MTKVRSCPECESPHVSNRVDRPGGVRSGDIEDKYRCDTCDSTFDEVEYREPKGRAKGGRAGISGKAKQLVEMEPDELGDDPRPAD